MAFPTMQTADVQHGVVTSNSSTWTLTYPTNLVSGDLILALLGTDGNATSASISGFTSVLGASSSGACSCVIFGRVSDGTETGTFSASIGASEQGGWRTLRITDWFGGTLSSLGNGVNDSTYVKAETSTGASTTPNPPSLDPVNWGTEDTLWIAAAGVDTSRTFSAWPTNYSPGDNTWDDVSGGAGGASLSVQWRQLNAASEDPDTFTISASDDWATLMVGVRPVAAAATSITETRMNVVYLSG